MSGVNVSFIYISNFRNPCAGEIFTIVTSTDNISRVGVAVTNSFPNCVDYLKPRASKVRLRSYASRKCACQL